VNEFVRGPYGCSFGIEVILCLTRAKLQILMCQSECQIIVRRMEEIETVFGEEEEAFKLFDGV